MPRFSYAVFVVSLPLCFFGIPPDANDERRCPPFRSGSTRSDAEDSLHPRQKCVEGQIDSGRKVCHPLRTDVTTGIVASGNHILQPRARDWCLPHVHFQLVYLIEGTVSSTLISAFISHGLLYFSYRTENPRNRPNSCTSSKNEGTP